MFWGVMAGNGTTLCNDYLACLQLYKITSAQVESGYIAGPHSTMLAFCYLLGKYEFKEQ